MKALVILMILYCCISGQRIRYISTEHPVVIYTNPKYVGYANMTSRRWGRGNPYYYVGFHFYALVPIDNDILVDIIFYEFLTNQYKRSFIQMHFGFCDLVLKNDFFGKPMRQGKMNQSCPFPPGQYNLYNMSIPFDQIPKSFPFKKGRIYGNVTKAIGPKEQDLEILGYGYIDMEVKVYNKKTNNVT